MKYFLIAISLAALMGCSSTQTASSGANSANNGIIRIQAPAITDQEFQDGLPTPDNNYDTDVPYQTQLQQSGGTYVKSLAPKTTKTTTNTASN